ncbi:MAG: hypothetical protein IT462_11845 [Planctomycetes bacterium]|nr:hypothetical protein [Planctomycetota bacterium]
MARVEQAAGAKARVAALVKELEADAATLAKFRHRSEAVEVGFEVLEKLRGQPKPA